MATVRIPDTNITLNDKMEIRKFLDERGIFYERWETEVSLSWDASQDQVLSAFAHRLKPFMEKGGYKTADVISVDTQTPNLDAVRDKFIREHTHSEDEVRLFVEGEGVFWFHREDKKDEVFSALCEKGDLISVPANHKHWFDLGKNPKVRAIRVFTDEAGWVPHYTNSGIDQRYK